MGYARIRPELRSTYAKNPWEFAPLQNIDGDELYWTPEQEWVKVVCFDAQETGLYVLTEDDDFYFTAHSADLEYSDTLPTPLYPRPQITPTKERPMGKHALPYNPHSDINGARDSFIEQLGQDLDTWQLIARDLARDILRGRANNLDTKEFAYDIINRLSHMPEMNIHPSERAR